MRICTHCKTPKKECETCGFNDIRALDFDHIDPKLKILALQEASLTVTHGKRLQMRLKSVEYYVPTAIE